MTTLRAAIRDVYDQVDAPTWAAPNLDALADVLRDLSWLPDGDVVLGVPELAGTDGERLRAVLERAVAETADAPHPVSLA